MSKFIVTATWDDVPHLNDEEKLELLQSIPPYQRDARSKGIPVLGSGLIYPIAQEDIEIDDFDIPKHWLRGYALDVGWNRTAVIWGAYDQDGGIMYLHQAHYRSETLPVVHAEAIKGRGAWIPGVVDPAARARNQSDGRKLMQIYQDLGLHLTAAPNAVTAGIYDVWGRLSTGKLKVFKSVKPWFEEFGVYRRDEKGVIVKKRDHLMDATRYLILAGIEWLQATPVDEEPEPDMIIYDEAERGLGWMS